MPEEKLADRIREVIHLWGYSIRTKKAYVSWYERYGRFHKLRHLSTKGAAEVELRAKKTASVQPARWLTRRRRQN